MIRVKGLRFLNVCVVLAALFLFAAAPVFADAVGKISFLTGRVDILKQGQDRAIPLESGAPVSLKDIIRTKGDSRAEITFNDGTVVRLAQSTRVGINNYTFDESGARKSGSLNLLRGLIRSITPKGSGEFEILTPNAKADARGTDFFFIYEKGSSWFYGSKGDLWALSRLETDPTLFDKAVFMTGSNCVRVSSGTSLQDSCVYNDIDIKKYTWETVTRGEIPVIAQLPPEGEVYTYTPLGGRAIDTPSLPVPIAAEDLNCTQCVFSIPPEPAAPSAATVKQGDFREITPPDNCTDCY